MADCECLSGCLFFNDKMPSKPAMAELMKSRYCRGDNSACARHMILVKLGKPSVPPDLFPGELEKATRIISSVQA